MDVILDTVKRALPTPIREMQEILQRTAYRFRNKGFKPYIIRKNVEGVVFDFWIGDRDGREWYDQYTTDPVWIEMGFIRDHLIRQGDVVLECGGHHGCTAILLSNWVGATGKVVTFEPSPANCAIIEKNIHLNGLKNVILEKKAVGAAKGMIAINDVSNSAVTLSGKGRRVGVVCLDEYEHLNPTLLKIDVEGYEMQVLQGARKILSTRPKLAIEIHTKTLYKYGASVQDLFKLINLKNYKMWIQWEASKEPEEYDMRTSIECGVHLFGIPLAVR